jgi:hypothetical protein
MDCCNIQSQAQEYRDGTHQLEDNPRLMVATSNYKLKTIQNLVYTALLHC